MLHIHHSNRLETLAGELISSYTHKDAHPFTSRIIITESTSLARWLKHQFCIHDGISCLVETTLPAAWLWKQARSILEIPVDEDPLTRERMQWLIYAALENNTVLSQATDQAQVSSYLKNDDTGLKRWQLACRIADCFDRYQHYRPELIDIWSAGKDKQWQAVLWREISKNIDTHRVALMNRVLKVMENKPKPDCLPKRLDLFSIHNLPPLLLNAYTAIARHIPVNLWLLAPTEEYWADLKTPREMVRKRLDDPDNSAYWETGNPLLTQWGRQGQAFQDLLLETNEAEGGKSQFHKPLSDSILGNLQADIYTAIDEVKSKSVNEKSLPSVQVHICHSAMRECQVLHDTLLRCLKENPDLEPEDILVLVPEISRYAPYIEAVFSRTPGKGGKQLPYNLSDIVLADEHPLIRAFLKLLELPESRFTRTELLSLLNLPEVRHRFGLNLEDNTKLAEIFDELRIYWGLDGKDKRERFKLPAIEDNTWQQGFSRIMAGYSLGSEQLYAGIAPQPGLTAQDAEPAARFFSLLNTLREWSMKLKEEATATGWAKKLNQLLADVFDENKDEDGRLSQIRILLSELDDTGKNNTTILQPSVIRHWLEKTLTSRADQSRFYSGGVSFCGMQPLRGVPFKVICLLGMQDQAFPRRHKNVEFDLMAKKWRHGDPDPALEDRYLFLETLLAAREHFIISYTGRNNRSNEPLQPSVVVQELIDYLDERYVINNSLPSKTLTRVHPLQAFGRNNFNNPEQRGFDSWWLATAKTVLKHQPEQINEGWPVIILPESQDLQRQISPLLLGSFFKHPVKQFVQQQLHIYEPNEIELVEDEPFDLNNLEEWQVLDQLLDHWQRNEADESKQLIMAHGLLPHGSLGEKLLSKKQAEFSELILSLNNTVDIQLPLKKLPVDISLKLSINGKVWRLAGRLQHIYENAGMLQISASTYSLAKALPLWIEHLCMHASKHPKAGVTHFVCKDASKQLQAIDAELAYKYLTDLVELYEAGLSSPLPFMSRSSSEWMESHANNKDAIKNARSKWKNNGWNGYSGEHEDFHARLILRGQDWSPDEDFAELAQRILEPLYNCMEPQA